MRKICFLLMAIIISCSGCYSIRKKFSRKNSVVKEPEVYLDLKNYPSHAASVEDYQDSVLYLNGWLDEALNNLMENGNRKRVRHSLAQALENMENVIDHYGDDGKRSVKPLYDDLKSIRDDFAKNSRLTVVDCNSFKRRIEDLKRSFTQNFRYDEVKKWLR